MPCLYPDHHHVWPKSGTLVIQKCETRCDFCNGDARLKDWRHAWFLRRHAETHVNRGEYPRVMVDAGWDVFNPTGRRFSRAPRIKREPEVKKDHKKRARFASPAATDMKRYPRYEEDKDDSEEEDAKPLKLRRLEQKRSYRETTPDTNLERPEQEDTIALSQFFTDSFVPEHLNISPANVTTSLDHYEVGFDDIALPPYQFIDNIVADTYEDVDDTQQLSSWNGGHVVGGHLGKQEPSSELKDVVKVLQDIAEGKGTNRDLPLAMRRFIVDTIGRKRMAQHFANDRKARQQHQDSSPRLTRSMHTRATPAYPLKQESTDESHPVNRMNTTQFLQGLQYDDGQAYINGVPLLHKPRSARRLAASDQVSGSIHQGPNEDTSMLECTQAVALGRMFAADHAAYLHNDHGISPKTMLQAEYPQYSFDTAHTADNTGKLHPEGVAEMLRKIQTGQVAPSTSECEPSMMGSTWAFPPVKHDAHMQDMNPPAGNSPEFDLDQLLDGGIPTAGEMKRICDSGYGSFDFDMIDFLNMSDFPNNLQGVEPSKTIEPSMHNTSHQPKTDTDAVGLTQTDLLNINKPLTDADLGHWPDLTGNANATDHTHGFEHYSWVFDEPLA